MDHKSDDTHHGGTSVVELDGTLGELLFLIEGIPSEVKVSVSEVTDEFVSGSGNILHDTNFEGSNKGNHLDKSSGRDGVRSDKGGNSVREGVEGVTGVINGSRKVESSSGDNLSEEGKHTDTSVLDLDVSETVESFLVDITVEESEGIEESKRGLGTELVLEGLDGGGGSLLLNRGESSGGGDEGGEDGRFHFEILCFDNCENVANDSYSHNREWFPVYYRVLSCIRGQIDGNWIGNLVKETIFCTNRYQRKSR